MIVGIIPLFFIELFISMKVGDMIGFFPSVLWIIVTMMAGSTLLRLSPYTFMGNIMSAKLGKIDIKSANSASMSYLIGAILLIVPGVTTDFIALFSLLYSFYLQTLAKIRPQQKNIYKQSKGDNDVIDVEIID